MHALATFVGARHERSRVGACVPVDIRHKVASGYHDLVTCKDHAMLGEPFFTSLTPTTGQAPNYRGAGFTPMALRHSRLFESNDVDFVRDHLSEILQPHFLNPARSSSSWPCYAEHIPVGQVGIGTIRFGNMHVHVPSIADYHLTLICLDGHADIKVNNEEFQIGGNSGLIIAPGEEMRGTFSEDCEQFFVRISSAAIRDHSANCDVRFRKRIDLNDSQLRPWLSQLRMIGDDPLMAQLIQDNRLFGQEYERLLVNLLLAGQAHDDSRQRSSSIAPGSVRKAEAFIHANLTEPITLADIAAASGVPTRTLLESFRRFRDTSPIRYLKDARLDWVRERLLIDHNVTASSAAMDAGFNHLGRFASEYLKRFGEFPSKSLRRNASRRR